LNQLVPKVFSCGVGLVAKPGPCAKRLHEITSNTKTNFFIRTLNEK